MYKELNKSIYPFDECHFCKKCDPSANTQQTSPVDCDRCSIGETPDRFEPIFESNREKELQYTVSILCDLIECGEKYPNIYNASKNSILTSAKRLINK